MEDEKIEEIIISEFAEADLDEIAAYHYSRSPNYVERIISERQGITKYRELIQEYYRIVYEISGNKVIVHTIIDGRRNFEEIIISKLSRYYGNKT